MHFKAVKEWQNKKKNDTKSSVETLIDDKCEKTPFKWCSPDTKSNLWAKILFHSSKTWKFPRILEISRIWILGKISMMSCTPK